MQDRKTIRYALLLAFVILAPTVSSEFIPHVYGATNYFLTPVPVFTQEGLSITLVLTVINALPSTSYQFSFVVKDPSGKNWTSTPQSHNTTATETQFSILIVYPSTSFGGRNSLVGQYNAQVNQIKPLALANVASTPFFILLTDLTEYQRTQTVNIRASGYNSTEIATVTIRTQTSSTLVFSRTVLASPTGVVLASWRIPKNATIDNYVVTVTGSRTVKTPPDVQGFSVKVAQMSIASLVASKSTYDRTETMLFSFTPVYPDGTGATTGVALLTLTNPGNVNVTLTATYNATAHDFEATYQTSKDNATGTWTARLAANAYGDGFGNTGPSAVLSASPQLDAATLNVNVRVNSYFATGQQVTFNATVTYPDGSAFQSGSAIAFFAYSANPGAYNYSVPVIFDNGLGMWVGSYNPLANDPGGLWSLTVKASDSSVPSNAGSSTRAVTLQDRPPVASFSTTPTSTTTGQSVSLDASSSYDPDGTILTYSWDFGDGTTGNGVQTTHTYNTASNPTGYTVTLVVTDNSGSTASAFSHVNVADRAPVVSFSLSTNNTSTGQTVTMSITSSDPDGTISSTRVDWGDGTVDTLSGPATSDNHSYLSAGSTGTSIYSITVTVTDNSASTTPSTKTIRIQTASTPSGSGNVSFPLFYFGIIAALIAALLIAAFLAFRRHKVTHARLKIDLEAVKSEAGRIENQEFFQSVKDQLKKDKSE